MFLDSPRIEFLSYFLAIGIGFVLGLIGAGGTILSVPLFVYFIGINPVLATTYSMFTVAGTSWFSAWRYLKQGYVNLKVTATFIIPSFVGVVLSRKIILPAIPDEFFSIGQVMISRDKFIMILFAAVMLIAAYFMVRPQKLIQGEKGSEKQLSFKIVPFLFIGFFTGILTGLVGSGGGFIVVPALTLLAGASIRLAIGTSLLIIALNTTVGFATEFTQPGLNWGFMIIFTLMTIIGSFIGIKTSAKIQSQKLKGIFGWFVILMAILILAKEFVPGLATY